MKFDEEYYKNKLLAAIKEVKRINIPYDWEFELKKELGLDK